MKGAGDLGVSLTGLHNQYTGYSINLAGGRITLLDMAFPFNLTPVCCLSMKHHNALMIPAQLAQGDCRHRYR